MSPKKIAYQEFGDRPAEPSDRPDLPPAEQPLRIQASRKGRKGKTVTVITGFQASPTTLKQLLKTLKNQCGTGGACKDGNVEIQGDHRQKLLTILKAMGYPAKVSGG